MQLAALEVLGALGPHAPTTLVRAALANPLPTVQLEAAAVLLRLGEPVPPDLIVTGLAHGHPEVRRRAAQVAEQYAGPLPLEAIKAAWRLGTCREYMPLEALVEAATDPDPWVRMHALTDLARFGEHAPQQSFIAALQDPDPGVRGHNASLLRTLGVHAPIEALVTTALTDPDFGVRLYATESLAELHEQASVDLTPYLSEEQAQDLLRTFAHYLDMRDLLTPGAVKRRRPSIQEHLRILQEGNPVAQLKAAEELLKEPAQDIPVEPVVAAFERSQKNGTVYEQLAALVGHLGERAPMAPLVQALHDDPDHDVRIACAFALINHGARTPVETLVRASLEDHDSLVRSEIWYGLSDLSPEAPGEALIPYLGSNDVLRREIALSVLLKLRPAALQPALQEAEAIFVEKQSGYILGSLVRAAFAEAIGELQIMTPQASEYLITLLDWPFWEVQRAAVQALSRLGIARSEPAVSKIADLQSPSHSRPLREAAREALKRR